MWGQYDGRLERESGVGSSLVGRLGYGAKGMGGGRHERDAWQEGMGLDGSTWMQALTTASPMRPIARVTGNRSSWPWVQGRFQEEVAMAVGPRTTALEVKERVALEAGMPPELQLIAFNGCPLEASPMLTSPEP